MPHEVTGRNTKRRLPSYFLLSFNRIPINPKSLWHCKPARVQTDCIFQPISIASGSPRTCSNGYCLDIGHQWYYMAAPFHISTIWSDLRTSINHRKTDSICADNPCRPVASLWGRFRAVAGKEWHHQRTADYGRILAEDKLARSVHLRNCELELMLMTYLVGRKTLGLCAQRKISVSWNVAYPTLRYDDQVTRLRVLLAPFKAGHKEIQVAFQSIIRTDNLPGIT